MITWKCHICTEERPDDKISVLSKPLIINGQHCGEQNIRYCNDRPACLERAKGFGFSAPTERKEREMTKTNTKAKSSVDFEILHSGLVDAVICTRLPIDEAIKRLNMENPTGIHSDWSFDGKESNKSPCPDGQNKTHYRLFC